MYYIEEFIDEHSGLSCIRFYNNRQAMTISPTHGGALCKLILQGKTIIAPPTRANHVQIFASSILFPFANRVDKGRYAFGGNNYQLKQNETVTNHAIHGLVYDKPFTVDAYHVDENSASITLSYTTSETEFPGFPFAFTIQLKYTINHNKLSLDVDVKNLSALTFPLSIGWHPYFLSEDIENRAIQLESDAKILTNNAKIPSEIATNLTHYLPINKAFDDCYRLTSNVVRFINRNYDATITSSSPVNYLQIFTPEQQKFLAIEFMTAPANCFNTAIDLLELETNEKYSICWQIELN